jgi:hypothetical protein
MCPLGRRNIFRLSVIINLNYYECSVWKYPCLKIPENSAFEKICVNLTSKKKALSWTKRAYKFLSVLKATNLHDLLPQK